MRHCTLRNAASRLPVLRKEEGMHIQTGGKRRRREMRREGGREEERRGKKGRECGREREGWRERRWLSG